MKRLVLLGAIFVVGCVSLENGRERMDQTQYYAAEAELWVQRVGRQP